MMAEICNYFRFAVIKSFVMTDRILLVACYTDKTGMTHLKTHNYWTVLHVDRNPGEKCSKYGSDFIYALR